MNDKNNDSQSELKELEILKQQMEKLMIMILSAGVDVIIVIVPGENGP